MRLHTRSPLAKVCLALATTSLSANALATDTQQEKSGRFILGISSAVGSEGRGISVGMAIPIGVLSVRASETRGDTDYGVTENHYISGMLEFPRLLGPIQAGVGLGWRQTTDEVGVSQSAQVISVAGFSTNESNETTIAATGRAMGMTFSVGPHWTLGNVQVGLTVVEAFVPFKGLDASLVGDPNTHESPDQYVAQPKAEEHSEDLINPATRITKQMWMFEMALVIF